jgi:hypothetical protein
MSANFLSSTLARLAHYMPWMQGRGFRFAIPRLAPRPLAPQPQPVRVLDEDEPDRIPPDAIQSGRWHDR